MTIYNMTKDLYQNNIDNIIVGVFDLLKYWEVIKAIDNKEEISKYFGFENLSI